jgi:hypothetical protein
MASLVAMATVLFGAVDLGNKEETLAVALSRLRTEY